MLGMVAVGEPLPFAADRACLGKAPAGTSCRNSAAPPTRVIGLIVTKPGRSWFSVPRPYSTHAPMLGRTNWKLPVCSCTAACGWFGRSVCMLLSRHRSSACLADVRKQFGDRQAAVAAAGRTSKGDFISLRLPLPSLAAGALPSSFARAACSRRYRRATARLA